MKQMKTLKKDKIIDNGNIISWYKCHFNCSGELLLKKRWGEKGGRGFNRQNWHGLKAWTIILIKQPMKLLDLDKHYDTNQRLAMDMWKSKITSFIRYPSRFDQTKWLTLFGANYLFFSLKYHNWSSKLWNFHIFFICRLYQMLSCIVGF